MLAEGISYLGFIGLMCVASIPSFFFRAFIIKGCWIMSQAFPASIEMIM
jgi:hypothetical protein